LVRVLEKAKIAEVLTPPSVVVTIASGGVLRLWERSGTRRAKGSGRISKLRSFRPGDVILPNAPALIWPDWGCFGAGNSDRQIAATGNFGYCGWNDVDTL
jgi:hypothetical protein